VKGRETPCRASSQGSQEQLGADEGRGRVAGQAQSQPPVRQLPEPGRLARPDVDRLDIQLQPERGQGRLDQVVVAHRGAADGDDDVGVDGPRGGSDGGGKVFFLGNALADLFLQSLNWPLGAAVAVALIGVMLVTIAL